MVLAALLMPLTVGAVLTLGRLVILALDLADRLRVWSAERRLVAAWRAYATRLSASDFRSAIHPDEE